MPRPPVGIYVDEGDDKVRFYGRRQRLADPPGLEWHDGLSITARSLLDITEDLRLLRWDGSTVRLRSQAERDAVAEADARRQDEGFFEDERQEAFAQAIMVTINPRLVAAGQAAVTKAELKAAYRAALGRS